MLAGQNKTDLISVFEGVGQSLAGKISKEKLVEIAETACQTCGSCAGMFTANSMNCLAEVIGLALPGNGTIPGRPLDKQEKRRMGKSILNRIKLVEKTADTIGYFLYKQVRPLNIITKKDSIDNAFILDLAMGGSTNTVLHTLALAHEAEIEYPLERINYLSDKTPNVCKTFHPGRRSTLRMFIASVGSQRFLKTIYKYSSRLSIFMQKLSITKPLGIYV